MNDCILEIVTRTEGSVSRFTAEGELELSGAGIIVTYPQDGDTVLLEAKENSLSMVRRGDTPLSSEFQLGKRTAMALKFGSASGKLPVFTSVYSCRRTKEGVSCNLGYELFFTENSQKFFLKISVKFDSEEK